MTLKREVLGASVFGFGGDEGVRLYGTAGISTTCTPDESVVYPGSRVLADHQFDRVLLGV